MHVTVSWDASDDQAADACAVSHPTGSHSDMHRNVLCLLLSTQNACFEGFHLT